MDSNELNRIQTGLGRFKRVLVDSNKSNQIETDLNKFF